MASCQHDCVETAMLLSGEPVWPDPAGSDPSLPHSRLKKAVRVVKLSGATESRPGSRAMTNRLSTNAALRRRLRPGRRSASPPAFSEDGGLLVGSSQKQ